MWSTISRETGELNFLVGNFWKILCILSKFQDNCPRYTIYSATKLFSFQRTDLHFFVKLGTAKNLLGFAKFYHIFILLENKLSFMHLKWHLYLKVFLTWLVLSEWVFVAVLWVMEVLLPTPIKKLNITVRSTKKMNWIMEKCFLYYLVFNIRYPICNKLPITMKS